jgi:hypothetical protein
MWGGRFPASAGLHLPRTGEETPRLVHAPEVHQIELEMQNAELRPARDEVETALGKDFSASFGEGGNNANNI